MNFVILTCTILFSAYTLLLLLDLLQILRPFALEASRSQGHDHDSTCDIPSISIES
jgi:hypothetical protein